MCGLAGIVYPSPRPIDGDTIERLFALLEHRGPDDQGWLALGPAGLEQGQTSPAGLTAQVVLVSRRLSILDLSEAGRQPMSSADGRFHLVYNGEIYNYVELRRELEALGHRFTSGTDTEVLLAGYFEWGPAALQRLVGMFAFAVLDVEDRSLFLARDFFGMKPLYYARVTGGVAFSSEIAPLLELPGVGRDVNPQRLYDFLRFDHTDYGGQTFFADVAELPPASCASVSLDRPIALEPVRYWSALTDERLDLSFDEAAAALRDLFLEGLDQHLRSDVSLGASLSGGVESSAIVMGMRALRGPELDLRTFSYVADEPSLNEELWIDAVAGAAGASTAKIGMTPRDFGADFDRVLEVQGEPFVELPVYAEYRVFGLAKKEGLSVILSGQGGDELFGGYSFFLAARLASLVRRGRLVQAARFAAQLRKLPRVRRVSDVVRSEGLLLPRAIRELLRPIGDEPLFPWWLDRDWFLERGVRPRPPVQAEGREALREKLHLSLTETKLPRLLRQGDRNSMCFSLECRLPFLTPRLARFALALPEEYHIAADGTSKAVFRRAMRGIVPDAVLDRQDKIGFGVPVRVWMGELRPWIHALLAGPEAERVSPLRIDALRDRLGPPGGSRVPKAHLFWRCTSLIRWAERFEVEFDGPTATVRE